MKRYSTQYSSRLFNVGAINRMKTLFLLVLLCGMSNVAFSAIIVTPATGGTGICSNTAVDGTATAYTTLGVITLTEGAVNDFGFGAGAWTAAITLNAPAGWTFNTGAAPALAFTPGADITAIGMSNFTTTAYTFTVTGTTRTILDGVTITGLQVRPNNTYSARGNITGGGSFGASGIGGGTNFATLSLNPSPIFGSRAVCVGSTATVSDTTVGGAWSSSNTALATVSGTGTVGGVGAGVVNIDYTVSGCITTFSLTVRDQPSAISGTPVVCGGSATSLSNTVAGGTWTSATTTVATVTSGGGVVSGVPTVTTVSTAVISYSVAACPAAQITVTVNPTPVISGNTNVCVGGTTTLSNSVGGGAWSSATSSVATVDAGGVVGGGSGGTSVITYSVTTTGCAKTAMVTVRAAPTGISGTLSVCSGASVTLSDAVAGGSWTSSNTSIATVTSGGGTVSGVPTVTVTATTVITYSVNACPSTTATFTVNPTPANITGTATVCQGSTTNLSDVTGGGTGLWTSSNGAIATVGSVSGMVTGVGAGTVRITYTLNGCFMTRSVTVNVAPTAIAGVHDMCTGTCYNISDAVVVGMSLFTSSGGATVTNLAPIGSSGGATVCGVIAGSATITYTLANGCVTSTTLNVNQSPNAITGTANVCQTQVTSLSDDTPGGTWMSGNTATATVDASGNVTGVGTGNVPITYTEPAAGCIAIATVTVNATPSSILGVTSVCVGSTTTLSNTSSGGTWSSDNMSIATITSSGGVASGVAGGTANITYEFGATCFTTTTLSVLPLAVPGAISGATTVCLGSTAQLSDDQAGGVWSSGNLTVATVTSGGLVSGVGLGSVTIYYTVTNSCGSQFTSYSMTVDQFTPDVSIGAVPGITTCLGIPDTFTATPVNGGSGPMYQWKVNGVIASVTNPFVYTPVNGDTVIVRLTSNGACLSTTLAYDTAVIVVDATLTPAVSISSNIYGDTVCVGTLTPYTAVPVNGGSAPAYDWKVNGISVGSGNPLNYVPNNGDIISVDMTSSYQCATPATVSSNSVTMTVDVTETPTVTVTSSANPSCLNSPVTYTAHTLYGGIAAFIRWTQNGVNVATGPTYTTIPNDFDQVYCVLKSSQSCRTIDSVFSNVIIQRVDSPIVPDVTVLLQSGIVSVGQSDTMIAVVTPVTISPTYQWYLNGVAIPGATLSYYIATPGATGASYYYCIVGNGNACNITRISNLVTVNAFPAGVNEMASGFNNLRMVPNPNAGAFTIEGTVYSDGKDVNIEVVNAIGQSVYKTTADAQNGVMKKEINLGNNLPDGVYMLHISSGNVQKVMRFVLSR